MAQAHWQAPPGRVTVTSQAGLRVSGPGTRKLLDHWGPRRAIPGRFLLDTELEPARRGAAARTERGNTSTMCVANDSDAGGPFNGEKLPNQFNLVDYSFARIQYSLFDFLCC